ncbi:CDK5 regulatory subunit-associated protein 3 [Babesia caballi]|uniref:CDK5 regulatory subunit-associated protein 3 n=1 Tax=Babesia caballi TaxID=5871 RepID=A0AAV4LR94_BABCB|nr:CDK5 regulatory subunit-associated protein 3 [Babesia caballi]
MSYEGESRWLLEVEPPRFDAKNVGRGSHEASDAPPLASVSTGLSDDGDTSPEVTAPLDGKKSMQDYIEEISHLNGAIDEFSKIIQTLALFKYYIRNRKGNTNLEELHKRFNTFSVKCANKVRVIQQHVGTVNRDNHYAMAHREKLGFSYADLRARFNMQDASVNRLKTLMETYQSVIKEYTAAAKTIEEGAQAAAKGGTTTAAAAAVPVQPLTASAEASLIDELKSKSKDIMTLEKNARDLNQLFAELNVTIKKRGENIHNLEQQILLSAEQIDKGKEDMESALSSRGGQSTCKMAPVELPYNQILNWVMARGKTPEDCSKRLLALEELCKGLFEKHANLPESVKELRKHALGDCTEWYEVICEINDKLKEGEDATRVNFLGQYTYEPLYEADRILRAFRKHNLHIVSYYQQLQKQVSYNVPSIKKSIERLNKELVECKTRKADSIRKLNVGAGELRNRLKPYNVEIDEYPFHEDFKVCLRVKLIQAIVNKNAEVTIENYRRTVELAQGICAEVLPVFASFAKLQGMEGFYGQGAMENVRHAAEHGMEATAVGGSAKGEASAEAGRDAAASDAAVIEVVKDDDTVPLGEERKQLIFGTALGNSSFRQLLLGEMMELRAFVRVRVDELQNRSDTANYLFSQAGGGIDEFVQQPLSKYEKYLEMISDVVERLSGTAAMRALSILKNRHELDNEVAEQAVLTKRIETTSDALQKHAAELEAVRAAVKSTKAKLEKAAAEVVGDTVKIFGEVDDI